LESEGLLMAAAKANTIGIKGYSRIRAVFGLKQHDGNKMFQNR
jgi:hypothetical protein